MASLAAIIPRHCSSFCGERCNTSIGVSARVDIER